MTRQQFRVLHREFLFRFVDRELLSTHAQGDMSKLLLQFAALLIFVSLLFVGIAVDFTRDMPPQLRLFLGWAHVHRLIALTMLVVGLFAVLSWQSMFPDRLDVHVLAPLPVRARTMFLAKVAAVATALSLTVLALHMGAGLAWPVALNIGMPAQVIPAMTSDPAIPPVGAADLRKVLDDDFANALRVGALAPGAGGGIVIGVYTRGGREVIAYGAATPDSLFEIGSVTKTFTGLLLAHMAAQGQVRLDAPVRALLPGARVARPHGHEITLLDLATHRSSLPAMDRSFRPADSANPFADYGVDRLYAFLATRGVERMSSARFRYSNLGFGLLGHALTTRAGQEYAPLVQEVITGPLGMRDTVVALSPDQRRRFLQGHTKGREPVPAFDLDVLAGAGALRSTAGDMLTFLEANLHPERLPAGTLSTALVSSHEPRAHVGPNGRIALAWLFDPASGTYSHGGVTAGHTADAFFNPKADFAAIVLSNTGGSAVVSADALGAHVRARLTGAPALSIAEMVIPATGSARGFMRLFAAYWFTMFAAGVFIFGLVMGVQGLAVQLLPRRVFLRVSSFLQMGAFALIVGVYCLQPGVGPASLIAAQQSGLLAWSPSYWFLGLFQQLTGSPALAPLARSAWIGLGLATFGTVAAYALAYFRTLRRIAEEPAIAPGARGFRWLPPFGNRLQTAVVQFSVRSLLRSPPHRVIVAFYLGMGFAAAIFFLSLPVAAQLSEASAGYPWHEVTAPLLAASILMLGFSAIGTRLACALPLDLRANWIFRIIPMHSGRPYLAARRRALLVLAVVPIWTATAILLLSTWPWRPAVGHLVVLALVGMLFVELCLLGIQKITFTCSYLPGKSRFNTAIWVLLLVFVPLVVNGAGFELEALQDLTRYAAMVAVLGLAWLVVRWRTGQQATDEAEPQFEEVPSDKMVALDVWDSRFAGATPHSLRSATSGSTVVARRAGR